MSRPFSAYWKQISLDTQAQKQFLWNESPDQGWASEKGFQQVAGRKETRQWDRRYCLLFYFVALIVECFLISQEFLDFVNFLQRFSWEKNGTMLSVLLPQPNHSTFSFKSDFSMDCNACSSTSINTVGTA